jgi:predicted ester cyclase
MSDRGNLNLEEELVTSHIDSQTLIRSAIEEIYNRGNLNLADEIAASHYVAHDPTFINTGTGSMGLKNHATALRIAFPDLHLNIEEMHSDGETVTTRLTAQGTHNGTLLNVRATLQAINEICNVSFLAADR